MKRYHIHQNPKTYPIYTTKQIRDLESAWFNQYGSAFGLMQQAAWIMAQYIEDIVCSLYSIRPSIMVWCGTGNNGGDGYMIAEYLSQKGFSVVIYAPFSPTSPDCQKAKQHSAHIPTITQWDEIQLADLSVQWVHIDAILGSGFCRTLDEAYCAWIVQFNQQSGYKIAIDLPSGLHPDTGQAMPIAISADITLCLLGLKMGILTGSGKTHAGTVALIPLIPIQNDCIPIAHICTRIPRFVPRVGHAHKGDFGHLLLVGGHQTMGGALILAAKAAFACGIGKVTVLCHRTHHAAVLGHCPNAMVQDIEVFCQNPDRVLLRAVDAVAVGMGLGRDAWAQKIYDCMLDLLDDVSQKIVWDADALYFLAQSQLVDTHRPKTNPQKNVYTPHAAEAARLLGCTVDLVNQDRMWALDALVERYGGDWVLKGAGSLVYQKNMPIPISVCAFGNAGMATAGMGDVLAGVLGALLALDIGLNVADGVALHALAADACVADGGQWGLQAQDVAQKMRTVIHQGFLSKAFA